MLIARRTEAAEHDLQEIAYHIAVEQRRPAPASNRLNRRSIGGFRRLMIASGRENLERVDNDV